MQYCGKTFIIGRCSSSLSLYLPYTQTMPLPDHEASTDPQPNKWGPYANARDFTANMLIPFAVLFCGVLFGLAVNVVIRLLLCARRSRGLAEDPEKQAGASTEATTLPTLLFSAGTKFTGSEAECAICLADFVEGDRIRVLPACNHGFHVQCVDRWLAARPSCPTCRVSCPVTSSQS